jgi:predicted metal-dependent hydrolase
MTYVKSDIDNKFYLVRSVPDKQQAANVLARLRNNVLTLADYLYKNRDQKEYSEYVQYIDRLHSKANSITIIESTQDSIYTSYSVNKGEQIVFCLRSRKNANMLHDINLMMYVVLHEISHVACPIYDNHGPLFKKIFAFITNAAIKIGLYTKINFGSQPEEYCGLMITDSIV